MRIKVADYVFQIHNQYNYCSKFTDSYITNEDVQYTICISPESLAETQKKVDGSCNLPYAEFLEIYRQICNVVSDNGGILIHGALIEFEGKGYIFTAPSGTGKTTHIRQWKKQFGDKVAIVNGDKPLIRFNGTDFIAYGTPWCGKEHYNINTSVPLKGIVLLSRGDKNSIQRVNAKDFRNALLKQVYLPKDSSVLIKVLDTADKMFTAVPIYHLSCNISQDAAITAMEAITKE